MPNCLKAKHYQVAFHERISHILTHLLFLPSTGIEPWPQSKACLHVQVARRKRLAAQQARIQKQLQEKVDRDRAEEQKRDAQHDHRVVHRERIEAWKSGKKVHPEAS